MNAVNARLLFLGLAIAVAGAVAHAQGVPGGSAPVISQPAPGTFPDPLPQFPVGSIRSLEQSKAAVAAAKDATRQQELHFEAQKKECYKKFLAEQCLIVARELDYKVRARINAVELEAHGFERQRQSDEHQQEKQAREAKRQAKDAQQQAERDQKAASLEKRKQDNAKQNADFGAKAGERAHNAEAFNQREQDRRADLAKKDAQARAEEQERAQRAIAEKERADEILKRAAEREAQQKQKEKDRAERARRGEAPKTPDLPGPPGAAGARGGDGKS
ncbi:MAG TPA: hypothetical protein VGN52_16490 [Burkholderiales bacterium]